MRTQILVDDRLLKGPHELSCRRMILLWYLGSTVPYGTVMVRESGTTSMIEHAIRATQSTLGLLSKQNKLTERG